MGKLCTSGSGRRPMHDVISFHDLETASEVPISCGTDRYAEEARILLWAYAIGDGPVKVWDCTESSLMPDDLAEVVWSGTGKMVWHNGGGFDAVVLHHQGYRIPIERMEDTMVIALAHSLPGALADLGAVLKLPEDMQKKAAMGKELIRLFCMPRPRTQKNRWADRHTHPAEWAKFKEYATYDIIAMREIYHRIPKWNNRGFERDLWVLDRTINNRGVCIDLELAKAAIQATNAAKAELAEECHELTDGEVSATTQRDKLIQFLLNEYSINLPDLRSSTVEQFLDGNGRARNEEIPESVRVLLLNRLQASKSSSAKYKRVMDATGSDGQLRGTLQFCGASRTGRWAGRIFQPQNLPRPTLEAGVIETGIEAMKLGVVDLVFDNVMELASSAIRGLIVAPHGRKLVVADLSNIEGRVLAWLAGEQWKLDAFYTFDAGNGPDLYKLAYSKSFGVPADKVNKDQRQIGKVQELALGYQGGVGAFLTFATAYGIDLESMAESAIANIPDDLLSQAKSKLEWTKRNERSTYGLSDDAFNVCSAFTAAWRDNHPEIVEWWSELESSAALAINNPGKSIECRKVKFQMTGVWLRIKLPSGRNLCYPNAQISEDGKLTYAGIDQFSRKWTYLNTYGGKLAENITQAVARDVLASTMPAIEKNGYAIALTVHDEIISEAPDLPKYNAEHLAQLMSTNPKWATGLPLAAAGFETTRYRKD